VSTRSEVRIGDLRKISDSRVYMCSLNVHALLEVSDIVMMSISVHDSCRLHGTYPSGILADLCSDLGKPKIPCQVGEPGLSPASGFEHPASTLPTRFPAALGIGHGHACGLANACALVYVAA